MLAGWNCPRNQSARPASTALHPHVARPRSLRRAIKADRIQPFFQPMVDLPSAVIVGFEILARWIGTAETTITPDVFIPLAESVGLLPLLTERLLQVAAREAMRWPDHLTLAVNISPRQLLDRGLPEFLRATLEPTGFPLTRLEVEITEQALNGNIVQAAAVAAKLRDMGICLVMDDYGAGASDLHRLEVLPFNKIKLDCSLVSSLKDSPGSRGCLQSVIALAKERGLAVVAEGIETEEQAEIMRGLRCSIAQGWLFGRPVPGRHVPSVLAPENQGIPCRDGAAYL
jgi:EAL domain-containing protein (putative c-di-GMP-specific phosphodiesterase class I)